MSVEDFKTYTGIDLVEELNEGKTPEIFLRDAENEIIHYVNLQSWRPITKWIVQNKFTPEQMDDLMEAILIQAKYDFENGNVLANNGIDPEQGVKMTPDDRYWASIAPMAIDQLKMHGLLTLVMRTRW